MDATLQTLIQHYGYWMVFVGTYLEGETILLLGGFAAHRGYLELPWVIFAAFLGSLLGDQFYFYLGRRHGAALLARRPQWAPQIDRARRLLEHYHTPLILGIRFMYGLRMIGPFVMGMSTLPALRFFILNALGAALWAVAIGLAGYLLGEALTALLGTIKHIELEVMAAIVLAGVVVWAVHFWRRRAARTRKEDSTLKKSA